MDVLGNNTFSETYLKLNKASLEAKEKVKSLSFLNISTLTLICDLSCEIDIISLSRDFVSPTFPICSIIRTKSHNQYELSSRGKQKKSFYNQVTIRYKDITTKSVKIFSNGRLQITGASSIHDAHTCINVVRRIVYNHSNKSFDEIEILAMRIVMINSNFSCNSGINIIKLQHIILQNNMSASYNPDVYPGLKVRFENDNNILASIFIFSTGNVVITGAKHINHVFDAYVKITSIMIDNFDSIRIKSISNISSPSSTHYIHGYPSRQFYCASTNA